MLVSNTFGVFVFVFPSFFVFLLEVWGQLRLPEMFVCVCVFSVFVFLLFLFGPPRLTLNLPCFFVCLSCLVCLVLFYFCGLGCCCCCCCCRHRRHCCCCWFGFCLCTKPRFPAIPEFFGIMFVQNIFFNYVSGYRLLLLCFWPLISWGGTVLRVVFLSKETIEYLLVLDLVLSLFIILFVLFSSFLGWLSFPIQKQTPKPWNLGKKIQMQHKSRKNNVAVSVPTFSGVLKFAHFC